MVERNNARIPHSTDGEPMSMRHALFHTSGCFQPTMNSKSFHIPVSFSLKSDSMRYSSPTFILVRWQRSSVFQLETYDNCSGSDPVGRVAAKRHSLSSQMHCFLCWHTPHSLSDGSSAAYYSDTSQSVFSFTKYFSCTPPNHSSFSEFLQ